MIDKVRNYQELLRKLHNMHEPNFLAFVSSKMHSISLNSFFEYLKAEKGISPKGVICCNISPNGSYLLNREDIVCIPESGYEFCQIENSNSKIELIQSTLYAIGMYFSKRYSKPDYYDKNFYIVFYLEKNVSAELIKMLEKKYHNRNIIVVMLEEGVGNYIRGNNGWANRWMAANKNTLKNLLVKQYFMVDQSIKTKLLRTMDEKNKFLRFNLFDNDTGRLTKNEHNCMYYKKLYETYCDNPKDDTYRNSIIINTQPFVEEKSLEEIDRNNIVPICNIAKRLGIKVIIKPHPRETHVDRYKQYGAELDMRQLPQEVLLAQSQHLPIAMVGYFSTALVTANLFWNIPSISIAKCMGRGVFGSYEADMDNFIDVFSEFLFLPNSFIELEEILQKQCSEGRII